MWQEDGWFSCQHEILRHQLSLHNPTQFWQRFTWRQCWTPQFKGSVPQTCPLSATLHASGCMLSCFSRVWLLVTLWVVDRRLLSMGFPRQKYWSGFAMPSSRGSSQPRDQTHISCVSCSANAEALGKPRLEVPMKHKLESRLPGEISITSDMQMTPPLWQKVKRN